MIIAKSKIDRTGKNKSDDTKQKNLSVLELMGKLAKRIYSGGGLKTGKGQEQHLTIPQEIGTESREYLTQRNPIIGVTYSF